MTGQPSVGGFELTDLSVADCSGCKAEVDESISGMQ